MPVTTGTPRSQPPFGALPPIGTARLRVEAEALTSTYGKFNCEPLERGFGTTLGNGIRRILLSSLQGLAIARLKVEGATDEFASLPNVAENVRDIILNLKEVMMTSLDDKITHLARLEKEGEGQVTAGDIRWPDGVEVLNPDKVIMNCFDGATVRMELEIRTGRGYVPADRTEAPTVGVFPIDALFSPCKKVNFQVTGVRAGQGADHDRLTMEVWTNGTIRPDEAVAYAANLFREQLSVFTFFDGTVEEAPAEDYRRVREAPSPATPSPEVPATSQLAGRPDSKEITKPLRTWVGIISGGWIATVALIAISPKAMFIYMPMMAFVWLLSGAVVVRWLQKS